MLRFRTLIVTGAGALGLAGAAIAGPMSPASAAGDPEVGRQVLNMLCASNGGSPVFTPFHIGRCQDARPKDGFEVEQLICEGLLEGSFETVSGSGRPNKVNWFCFHGPIAP